MEEQKEPKFYNVEQLSNILGISRSKTYELVSSLDCLFVALKIKFKLICISFPCILKLIAIVPLNSYNIKRYLLSKNPWSNL